MLLLIENREKSGHMNKKMYPEENRQEQVIKRKKRTKEKCLLIISNSFINSFSYIIKQISLVIK